MALSDYKIDLVQGKNANPSQSGNSNHPNASYLCKQFNDLIDELEENGTGGGISNLNGFTTDNLAEGTTNKYFSQTLARNAISINTGSSGVTYVNGLFDFSNLQVGANLSAFSATGYSGFTYNPSNGIFNLDVTNLQGADGDDGLSAYQIWLNQGNTGTVQDFLLSLKGASGVSLDWRGTWSSSANYLIDDAVSYNGSSYIAKTANTNKQPDTNPSDWDLWVAKGDIGNNGQSIDHLSLTSTVGKTKTYTVWGNIAETINLGTFTVTDGADGTSLLYWSGTQAQYDALGTYSNNTLYLITG
jgi:hypothetical protein